MSSGSLKENVVEIKEGSATMYYDTSETVFYNKVQVLNRDISIQVIKLFSERLQAERDAKYRQKLATFEASTQISPKTTQKEPLETAKTPPTPPERGIRILDALAATGLRSIRYLKEIPLSRHVTINDIEQIATLKASQNIAQNHIPEDKVAEIHHGDAVIYMHTHRNEYDVIDLDPYGSATPFIDSAIQAIKSGGLLCITCTDMTVLASANFPEVCYAKYGGIPLRARYNHEMALRILLLSLSTTASKYKKYIVPWLSMSVDFYIRVFIRVFEQPSEVKRSLLKTAYVLQSSQTSSFYLQPVGVTRNNNFYGAPFTSPSACQETNGRLIIGGPIWSDPIHQQDVVDELRDRIEAYEKDVNVVEDTGLLSTEQLYPPATRKRMLGLLTSMSEELKDVPLYYYLPDLAGFRVSSFHHEPLAIKTDAPPAVIWDIMRAYCALHPPVGSKHRKDNKISEAILGKESTIKVDFTSVASVLEAREREIVRFPPNPEENWGPKRRAGKLLKEEEKEDDDHSMEEEEEIDANRKRRKDESEQ